MPLGSRLKGLLAESTRACLGRPRKRWSSYHSAGKLTYVAVHCNTKLRGGATQQNNPHGISMAFPFHKPEGYVILKAHGGRAGFPALHFPPVGHCLSHRHHQPLWGVSGPCYQAWPDRHPLSLLYPRLPQAIYIEGEKDAKVVIEVSMTGGRVSLDGPFKYCSEPALAGGEAGTPIPDSICAALMSAEEKPESSD